MCVKNNKLFRLPVNDMKLVCRFVTDAMVTLALERLLCLHLVQERTSAGTQDALRASSVTTSWWI